MSATDSGGLPSAGTRTAGVDFRWPCGHTESESGFAYDGCARCGISAAEFASRRYGASATADANPDPEVV